ncbi:MAG: alpha amylase C-terminal domain-containing protein, partial [Pseudomonadota bacterium]
NHMANAGQGALGLGGTFYFGGSYSFPNTYTPADFHYCGTDPGGARENDIFDFGSRFEVQNCELVGLADIDTSAAGPRATLIDYLQTLINFGVDGFRVDAAKHVSSMDLGAIFAGLTGDPYIVQEVIDSPSEQVRFYEYLVHGDVTEFDYGPTVGGAFTGCSGTPAGLQNIGGGFGLDDSDNALVFTDNHDTQRAGGCRVTFESGPAYDLANVFMLAYPYGYPRVMSSYHFATESSGPPSSSGVTNSVWIDGEPAGCNDAEFVCEHRRPAMRNLAKLRELAGANPVTNWWDDGNQRIAFGRGDQGYVALNAASSTINRAWQTSMAPGTYCNVALYELAGD